MSQKQPEWPSAYIFINAFYTAHYALIRRDIKYRLKQTLTCPCPWYARKCLKLVIVNMIHMLLQTANHHPPGHPACHPLSTQHDMLIPSVRNVCAGTLVRNRWATVRVFAIVLHNGTTAHTRHKKKHTHKTFCRLVLQSTAQQDVLIGKLRRVSWLTGILLYKNT